MAPLEHVTFADACAFVTFALGAVFTACGCVPRPARPPVPRNLPSAGYAPGTALARSDPSSPPHPPRAPPPSPSSPHSSTHPRTHRRFPSNRPPPHMQPDVPRVVGVRPGRRPWRPPRPLRRESALPPRRLRRHEARRGGARRRVRRRPREARRARDHPRLRRDRGRRPGRRRERRRGGSDRARDGGGSERVRRVRRRRRFPGPPRGEVREGRRHRDGVQRGGRVFAELERELRALAPGGGVGRAGTAAPRPVARRRVRSQNRGEAEGREERGVFPAVVRRHRPRRVHAEHDVRGGREGGGGGRRGGGGNRGGGGKLRGDVETGGGATARGEGGREGGARGEKARLAKKKGETSYGGTS